MSFKNDEKNPIRKLKISDVEITDLSAIANTFNIYLTSIINTINLITTNNLYHSRSMCTQNFDHFDNMLYRNVSFPNRCH